MTEKELDKLDNQETIAMLKEIDENYSSLDLPIVEPKYNKNGELTNEKEVKKSLKLILPILLVLWERNIAITTTKSIKIMTNTNLYVNTLKTALKRPKTSISVKEWNDIMDKLIKDRQNKIKIKQVIRGNANMLNKQVQDTVLKMYKDGKNYKQTAKELQKQFGYNKNKAKSIAITEKNYYKSEAQLRAIESITKKNKKMYKKPIFKNSSINRSTTEIGQPIQDKIKNILEQNENLNEAPLIYTDKADGVMAGYNIS